MDWKFLFTSFEGRIGRRQFWLGAVVLFAVALILTIVIVSALGGSLVVTGTGTPETQPTPEELLRISAINGWTNLIVFLIMVWPGLALCLKRRHDRGSDGRLVWVSFGFSLLAILLQATGLGYGIQTIGEMDMVAPNFLGSIVALVVAILGLYLLVVLGFLKGDSGDNAYGPDPLQS